MSRWVLVSFDAFDNKHVIGHLADSLNMGAAHEELREEAGSLGVNLDGFELVDAFGNVMIVKDGKTVGEFDWRNR